jgi:periplasmic divalent cation tolerance protein
LREILDNTNIIVLVTTANKQEAEKILRNLLDAKLIACANVVGSVSSHFHWSGKIQNADECMVFMKSRRDLFAKLEEIVRSLHSYEVPEILAIPIIDGSRAYLDWLESSLK